MLTGNMSSSQSSAYTDFYKAYAWKLEDEVKRHENLLELLQQQGNLALGAQIKQSMEIAKAKLETCNTVNMHAQKALDKAIVHDNRGARKRASRGSRAKKKVVKNEHPKSRLARGDSSGSPTNGIDLLIQASLEPHAGQQHSSVTRGSDGVVFQVQQRVSFVDPKSGFYVDGVVVSIRGPHLVEVGYWGSSWSRSKYNQVVPIDKVLSKGRLVVKRKRNT